eukprot:PhM_4_TR8415/c2_g1_i4/m.8210
MGCATSKCLNVEVPSSSLSPPGSANISLSGYNNNNNNNNNRKREHTKRDLYEVSPRVSPRSSNTQTSRCSSSTTTPNNNDDDPFTRRLRKDADKSKAPQSAENKKNKSNKNTPPSMELEWSMNCTLASPQHYHHHHHHDDKNYDNDDNEDECDFLSRSRSSVGSIADEDLTEMKSKRRIQIARVSDRLKDLKFGEAEPPICGALFEVPERLKARVDMWMDGVCDDLVVVGEDPMAATSEAACDNADAASLSSSTLEPSPSQIAGTNLSFPFRLATVDMLIEHTRLMEETAMWRREIAVERIMRCVEERERKQQQYDKYVQDRAKKEAHLPHEVNSTL